MFGGNRVNIDMQGFISIKNKKKFAYTAHSPTSLSQPIQIKWVEMPYN